MPAFDRVTLSKEVRAQPHQLYQNRSSQIFCFSGEMLYLMLKVTAVLAKRKGLPVDRLVSFENHEELLLPYLLF
jgi:hypothetical protein